MASMMSETPSPFGHSRAMLGTIEPSEPSPA
jgi:hypothetical protein